MIIIIMIIITMIIITIIIMIIVMKIITIIIIIFIFEHGDGWFRRKPPVPGICEKHISMIKFRRLRFS